MVKILLLSAMSGLGLVLVLVLLFGQMTSVSSSNPLVLEKVHDPKSKMFDAKSVFRDVYTEKRAKMQAKFSQDSPSLGMSTSRDEKKPSSTQIPHLSLDFEKIKDSFSVSKRPENGVHGRMLQNADDDFVRIATYLTTYDVVTDGGCVDTPIGSVDIECEPSAQLFVLLSIPEDDVVCTPTGPNAVTCVGPATTTQGRVLTQCISVNPDMLSITVTVPPVDLSCTSMGISVPLATTVPLCTSGFIGQGFLSCDPSEGFIQGSDDNDDLCVSINNCDAACTITAPSFKAISGVNLPPECYETAFVGEGVELTLDITFDMFPSETGWTLSLLDGISFERRPPGTYMDVGSGASIREQFISPPTVLEFNMTDSAGDGMCCGFGNGMYTLYLGDPANDIILASGGSFGFVDTTVIDITPTPDMFNLTLVLDLDAMPEELGWELAINGTNEVLVVAMPPTYANQTMVSTIIASVTPGTYSFTVTDSAADGYAGTYALYVDDLSLGEIVAQGGPFMGASETTVFTIQARTSAPSMAPSETPLEIGFTLVIDFDQTPQEFGWTLEFDDGTLVGRAPIGTYVGAAPGSTSTIAISTIEGSFNFTALDSGGNGLCCGNGNGSYTLYFQNFVGETSAILAQGSMFGFSESTSFVAPPPYIPPDFNVTVVINFDSFPEQTGWLLAFSNGTEVSMTGAGSYVNVTSATEIVTVKPGSYVFTITDTAGDGICCASGMGSYAVYIGDAMTGQVVAQGSMFTFNQTTSFDVVDQNAPTMSPTNMPSFLPTGAPSMPFPAGGPPPLSVVYRMFTLTEGTQACETVVADWEVDCTGTSEVIILLDSADNTNCVQDGPLRLRCENLNDLGAFGWVEFACEGRNGTALTAEGTFFEQPAQCLSGGGDTFQLMTGGPACPPDFNFELEGLLACTGNSFLAEFQDGGEYCISGIVCDTDCSASIPSFRAVIEGYPNNCFVQLADDFQRPPTSAPAAPSPPTVIDRGSAFRLEHLWFIPNGTCTRGDVTVVLSCADDEDEVIFIEAQDPQLYACTTQISTARNTTVVNCVYSSQLEEQTSLSFGCQGTGSLIPLVDVLPFTLQCTGPDGVSGVAFQLDSLCEFLPSRGIEVLSTPFTCDPPESSTLILDDGTTFCIQFLACNETCSIASSEFSITKPGFPDECTVPALPTMPPIIPGPFLSITIVLDSFPSEVGWELTEAGVVIAGVAPGSYTNVGALETIVETVPIDFGTYTFSIMDTGNDGICCQFGMGSYQVTFRNTPRLFAEGGMFGGSENTTFVVGETMPPSQQPTPPPTSLPPTVPPAPVPTPVLTPDPTPAPVPPIVPNTPAPVSPIVPDTPAPVSPIVPDTPPPTPTPTLEPIPEPTPAPVEPPTSDGSSIRVGFVASTMVTLAALFMI